MPDGDDIGGMMKWLQRRAQANRVQLQLQDGKFSVRIATSEGTKILPAEEANTPTSALWAAVSSMNPKPS